MVPEGLETLQKLPQTPVTMTAVPALMRATTLEDVDALA